MAQVVTLGLHCTEGGAAQPVQLQCQALPFRTEHLPKPQMPISCMLMSLVCTD